MMNDKDVFEHLDEAERRRLIMRAAWSVPVLILAAASIVYIPLLATDRSQATAAAVQAAVYFGLFLWIKPPVSKYGKGATAAIYIRAFGKSSGWIVKIVAAGLAINLAVIAYNQLVVVGDKAIDVASEVGEEAGEAFEATKDAVSASLNPERAFAESAVQKFMEGHCVADCLKLALSSGLPLDVNRVDEVGDSALSRAAMEITRDDHSRSEAALTDALMLLERPDIDVNSGPSELRNGSDTMLQHVIYQFSDLGISDSGTRQRTLRFIEAMLTQPDVDVNALDGAGMSMLHYAALSRPDNDKLLDLLLAHPSVDVNLQDSTMGWSALVFAARHGNVKAVEKLLQHGNINAHLRGGNSGTTADQHTSDPNIKQLIREAQGVAPRDNAVARASATTSPAPVDPEIENKREINAGITKATDWLVPYLSDIISLVNSEQYRDNRWIASHSYKGFVRVDASSDGSRNIYIVSDDERGHQSGVFDLTYLQSTEIKCSEYDVRPRTCQLALAFSKGGYRYGEGHGCSSSSSCAVELVFYESELKIARRIENAFNDIIELTGNREPY